MSQVLSLSIELSYTGLPRIAGRWQTLTHRRLLRSWRHLERLLTSFHRCLPVRLCWPAPPLPPWALPWQPCPGNWRRDNLTLCARVWDNTKSKVCSLLGLQQIDPSTAWDQRSRSSLPACWDSLHVCSSHCRPARHRGTPGGRRSTSSNHTLRRSEEELEAPHSVGLKVRKRRLGTLCTSNRKKN